MNENPEKKPPRISVLLSASASEQLERYAKQVRKDKTATVAAYLIQQSLDELDRAGEIPKKSELISTEQFDQIIKFIKLLLGEHSGRNGISFVILSESLGVDAAKLKKLYEFVEECRKNHHTMEL